MQSDLEEITIAELVNGFLEDFASEFRVAMPAKVESYDSSAQTVDVVPALNKSIPDGDGNYLTQRLPKLAAVPVKWQRCGQFAMTFPIAAGDYGLLVFCDRSLAAWRSTGNQGDPGDLGQHGLDGAVFLPGLFPDSKTAQSADSTNMVIGSETSGDSRIELKPSGGINLGAGASKGVARNGDHSDAGTLTINFSGTGTVSGSYTDPDSVTTPWTAGTPITLKAKLNEGSAKIKAID